MAFDSWVYLLFLPAVLAGYFLLRHRAQNVWLLAASYLFYGWWDWRFLGLLLVSSFLDWFCSLRIEASPDPRVRRRWLAVAVVGSLGILGAFKYLDFFAGSAARLLGMLGFEADWTTLGIVLPVGISFYTFQSMSYTIDVYRRHLPACRSPIDYALYVTFFPQLVAGPIERATRLLPQVQRPRTVTNRHLAEGAFLILLGLFKKIGIADAVSHLVIAAHADVEGASTVDLWRGVYLFTFQIYGDFSGYSDIARGSAKLLGFELMENFRQPFLARSFADLWRRWHVSLSTWLRDYLFIPLGGSHGSKARVAINLLLTMTISGLWHGAAWTFVIWGFLHGLALAGERFLLGPEPKARPPVRGPTAWAGRVARTLLVFHALALLFVLFRSPDLDHAFRYLAGLLRFDVPLAEWTGLYLAVFYGAILLVLDVAAERAGHHVALLSWPAWARSAAYAAMILAVLCWSWGLGQPFIYFQF